MSLSTSLIEQLKSSRELPLPPGSKGVFVSDVVKGSPACSAGILPGDVIVAIDSKDIQHTQELLKILGLRVGEEIRLTILRTVALEQDWDGRIMRYDIERKELVVTPSDLGAFLSASST